MKTRLDKELVARALTATRSQAEDVIRRGYVEVAGKIQTKAGMFVNETTSIRILPKVSFVSRAGEKLYSVAEELGLQFQGKTVLDVGSSTGGFTEVSLRGGARKVIAVDVGTDQLDVSLRDNPQIELHEKTDIRAFRPKQVPDLVVIDASFISLREILPTIYRMSGPKTEVVAMVKPQFEAAQAGIKHKGVVKNDHMRREIFKVFEGWVKNQWIVENKADSKVAGAKGNLERFYKLKKLATY